MPLQASRPIGIITISSAIPARPLSSFEWIGNHYRIIGTAADPATEAWWKRLRHSMKSLNATRIPRSGPLDGPDAEAWALPSALAKIRAGAPGDVNP